MPSRPTLVGEARKAHRAEHMQVADPAAVAFEVRLDGRLAAGAAQYSGVKWHTPPGVSLHSPRIVPGSTLTSELVWRVCHL